MVWRKDVCAVCVYLPAVEDDAKEEEEEGRGVGGIKDTTHNR